MICSMFFPVKRNFGPLSNLQHYGKVVTFVWYWPDYLLTEPPNTLCLCTVVLTLRGQALLIPLWKTYIVCAVGNSFVASVASDCFDRHRKCLAVNGWGILSYLLACLPCTYQQPQCNVFLLH